MGGLRIYASCVIDSAGRRYLLKNDKALGIFEAQQLSENQTTTYRSALRMYTKILVLHSTHGYSITADFTITSGRILT